MRQCFHYFETVNNFKSEAVTEVSGDDMGGLI